MASGERRGRRRAGGWRGEHTCVKGTAGGGEDGGDLEWLGLETIREVADGYDGWDQRVSVAPDEPTIEKYRRRSNRRCN
jgi:hypothetical protein